jgi:hypothetical protein
LRGTFNLVLQRLLRRGQNRYRQSGGKEMAGSRLTADHEAGNTRMIAIMRASLMPEGVSIISSAWHIGAVLVPGKCTLTEAMVIDAFQDAQSASRAAADSGW